MEAGAGRTRRNRVRPGKGVVVELSENAGIPRPAAWRRKRRDPPKQGSKSTRKMSSPRASNRVSPSEVVANVVETPARSRVLVGECTPVPPRDAGLAFICGPCRAVTDQRSRLMRFGLLPADFFRGSSGWVFSPLFRFSLRLPDRARGRNCPRRSPRQRRSSPSPRLTGFRSTASKRRPLRRAVELATLSLPS